MNKGKDIRGRSQQSVHSAEARDCGDMVLSSGISEAFHMQHG